MDEDQTNVAIQLVINLYPFRKSSKGSVELHMTLTRVYFVENVRRSENVISKVYQTCS